MIKVLTIAAALGMAVAIYQYVGPADAPIAPIPQPAGENLATQVTEENDDSTEVVLRKNRNCTVELKDYVTTDGKMFSAWSCTPLKEAVPHPYAHYDDAALEVMAWADAEAAALLGQRLVGHDHDKSYELLVRDAALDGNVRHLHWLADQAFSAVQIDGEVQVANIKRRYELAALATHFGDDPENERYYRHVLLNAGATTGQIDELDSRVDERLRNVRNIQREVFGEVRHGGQNDA
jgi:hypothetical protein